jgi:hypothetical protein
MNKTRKYMVWKERGKMVLCRKRLWWYPVWLLNQQPLGRRVSLLTSRNQTHLWWYLSLNSSSPLHKFIPQAPGTRSPQELPVGNRKKCVARTRLNNELNPFSTKEQGSISMLTLFKSYLPRTCFLSGTTHLREFSQPGTERKQVLAARRIVALSQSSWEFSI